MDLIKGCVSMNLGGLSTDMTRANSMDPPITEVDAMDPTAMEQLDAMDQATTDLVPCWSFARSWRSSSSWSTMEHVVAVE